MILLNLSGTIINFAILYYTLGAAVLFRNFTEVWDATED